MMERTHPGYSLLDFAERVYKDRNIPKEARKAGWIGVYPLQPKGLNSRSGIWMPAPQEVRVCCQQLRDASLKFPYVFHRHCRLIKHVALLIGVDERDLSRRVKRIKALPRHCAFDDCGKFVPKDDYICDRCRFIHRLDKVPLSL